MNIKSLICAHHVNRKGMNKSGLFGAISILLLCTTSAHAAVVYSQPVLDNEPMYFCGECADSFVLSANELITGVKLWGGYGLNTPPSQDLFSVNFYQDTGFGTPQDAAFASYLGLSGTRVPTGFLTVVGDDVFEYELALPQALLLQEATTYYISVRTSPWFWSGSGWGDFWFRVNSSDPWTYSAPGNPHNLAFELTSVPIPAALWLFSSGFIGLVGVARRKV